MPQIESFSIYHIGIKITPSVNLDLMASKLKEMLGKEGYPLSGASTTERPRILPPTEVLATRNGVQIEMNYVSSALNTSGSSPPAVSKVFRELPHFLVTLGYELPAIVQFYETVATIIAKSEIKPADALSRRLHFDMRGFEDMGELKITAVRATSEMSTEKSALAIIVQPNPESPNSRFVLQVQYRSDKKEDMTHFQESINGRLERFMEPLR